MNKESYLTEHLSDPQMVQLLNIGLDPSGGERMGVSDDFWDWVEMAEGPLSRRLEETLKRCELGEADVAPLLGVNQLTVRRWFSMAKPFSRSVKEKLGGLGYLLTLYKNDDCPPPVRRLIEQAINGVRTPARQVGRARTLSPLDGVLRIFGPMGLMAVALYLATCPREEDIVPAEIDEP